VKHFSGNTITVEQAVWESRVQSPKTVNANRQVDLQPDVAAMLRDFIGDRKEGFIFRTRTGTPFRQSNFLRYSLHPILEELGIEKQGFHSFRRFRVTHLESSYAASPLGEGIREIPRWPPWYIYQGGL
jgi:integrase